MENEKKKSKWKFIRNIIIVLVALGIVALIFYKAPDYILPNKHEGISLIINNKDVTINNRLKNKLIIEDGVIYLSKSDISNFFDKYLYYDEMYDQYITTSGTKEATIKTGQSKIEINGITSNIKGKIIQRDGQTYFPFSDMNKVYNVEIQNIEDSKIVLVDSLDREQIQVEAANNLDIKVKTKIFCRTIDKVEKGEKMVLVSDVENGWSKVRTKNGKIGYVETKNLTNKVTVRENQNTENNTSKVSLVWDYYSQYVNVPNRLGSKIDGINAISPAFFELEKLGKGTIIDKTGGTAGKQYINWAKQNQYKVWPMFQNDGMIDTTKQILNDYELRKKVIEQIVTLIRTYNLDGINIDFENMYKEDKDMFSRFIIELHPRIKELGATLSVDVTAPDGGETWSQCFDRNVIAENCDYIIFMAYDQYSQGSSKAGTTAGYNWIKNNVDKFLGQEGVAKEKLVLALPFYSRLWTENNEQKPTSTIVNMKDINTAIPQNAERTWDEVLKQYYVQYEDGGKIKKIWLEEINSFREKLKIVKEYDLAGAAYWSLDRQDDSIWNEINNIILSK